ncbi:hypothetical protein [Effusibacillus dendaii]|uniref:Uncharacterized protein n=1 Tax=Effusibacillus dendaii TaxID=2743772 RepID=A0A7I8D8N5_9BACL|nr:hypothetical protein [Effusibacillus dendaii]BCJ86445.1 hypothetical protein skT53_14300 [Effusibacillus dendaii]
MIAVPESIAIRGDWLFTYEDGMVIEAKNLITQAGLNLLASLLINEQSNSLPFHLAMGIGTTAAAAGDTKLQTETFRKIVSAKSRQANMARIRTFLLSGEANGNFNEFGIFVAGTDAKDSGTLLNRLVTPISKTAQTVLTVECRLTFTAG